MVMPLRDRLPTSRRPWVNRLLLLINIVVFVFFEPWAAPDPCVQQAFFLEHAAIPAEIAQGEPLDSAEVAASTSPECALSSIPDKPVYFSIISAMFLHAGWAHLLGNMLFLWIFGDNVEDRYGHLRYLGFYLLCGALATLAFVVPSPGNPSTLVGASGAIAGVLGSYLLMFPRSRITVIVMPLWFLPFRLPALVVLGFWLVLQLVEVRVDSMAGGGVAYLAHVAGFVAGLVLTYIWGVHRGPHPAPAMPRRRGVRGRG
jgi:membrane associated rhomboid family serine protease